MSRRATFTVNVGFECEEKNGRVECTAELPIIFKAFGRHVILDLTASEDNIVKYVELDPMIARYIEKLEQEIEKLKNEVKRLEKERRGEKQ